MYYRPSHNLKLQLLVNNKRCEINGQRTARTVDKLIAVLKYWCCVYVQTFYAIFCKISCCVPGHLHTQILQDFKKNHDCFSVIFELHVHCICELPDMMILDFAFIFLLWFYEWYPIMPSLYPINQPTSVKSYTVRHASELPLSLSREFEINDFHPTHMFYWHIMVITLFNPIFWLFHSVLCEDVQRNKLIHHPLSYLYS